MTVELRKGGRVNLTKIPQLQQVGVGLGWDVNEYGGAQFDLDASAFLLNLKGKTPEDEFFVFYNNLYSPDESVEHTGDNRTGAGDGDDETLIVDLTKTRSDITEILFVVTIHEAELRKQNFGQVRNAYIRIFNMENNQEIAKYNLEDEFSYETGIEFGRIYRNDNQWRFVATGKGFGNGLQGFVDKYI